jgi:hypothetical protein
MDGGKYLMRGADEQPGSMFSYVSSKRGCLPIIRCERFGTLGTARSSLSPKFHFGRPSDRPSNCCARCCCKDRVVQLSMFPRLRPLLGALCAGRQYFDLYPWRHRSVLGRGEQEGEQGPARGVPPPRVCSCPPGLLRGRTQTKSSEDMKPLVRNGCSPPIRAASYAARTNWPTRASR